MCLYVLGWMCIVYDLILHFNMYNFASFNVDLRICHWNCIDFTIKSFSNNVSRTTVVQFQTATLCMPECMIAISSTLIAAFANIFHLPLTAFSPFSHLFSLSLYFLLRRRCFRPALNKERGFLLAFYCFSIDIWCRKVAKHQNIRINFNIIYLCGILLLF